MAHHADPFIAIEAVRVKGDNVGLFRDVTSKDFSFQAQFYLNAFAETSDADKEFIYTKLYKTMQKLDRDQWDAEGKNPRDYLETGNLTLEWAHKFFELVNKPMTQLEFKKIFTAIDTTSDGKLSLLEYLCYLYNRDIPAVCGRPQVNNPDIANAQRALDDANAAIAAQNGKEQAQQDIIDNPDTSSVKRSKAANQLKQLQNEGRLALNTDLETAKRLVRNAAKKSTPESSGRAWWTARVLTEATLAGPQKAQNKA